ncbi:MAG: hypothetical protein K9H64_14045 [Bacteroidales bacterium]|nr:hypothetical protein [Bacteroidales bacterium]MCF8457087.1 hypothetical protein [Bacteroidales bacterium]
MKYKKSFYLILVILTIFSCKEKATLQELKIDTICSIIKIPSVYKKVEESDIRKFINQKEDELFRDELLNFASQNSEDLLLLDTLNPFKFILISEIIPSIQIDSIMFWLIIDQEREKSCNEPKPDSTYYVGSKLKILKNIKYIESKHVSHDRFNRQRVGYSFIISANNKTVGIGFFGPEEQDISNYINSIE